MNEKSVRYSSIDTPAVLVDMDTLEANIQEMAQVAREAKIDLRPHVEVHQCPEIAMMQIAAGARGIEVGNIDQAEAMAEAGVDDIIIVHPFYGERKMEKLQGLIKRPGLVIGVVIDMIEQVYPISKMADVVGVTISVHIKLETDGDRYGVMPGSAVLNLVRELVGLPGLKFEGIYAHESGTIPTAIGVSETALKVGMVVSDTVKLLKQEGFHVGVASVGASPTFRATCRFLKNGSLSGITEIHPGGCVVGDMFYVKSYGSTMASCALRVLSTVVSTSHNGHVVIDAGLKTFGGDSLITRRSEVDFFWRKMPRFGVVVNRPDTWLGRLGAESGWLYYLEGQIDSMERLVLGERLEILPNNSTVVINLHNHIYGVRNGEIEKEFLYGRQGPR